MHINIILAIRKCHCLNEWIKKCQRSIGLNVELAGLMCWIIQVVESSGAFFSFGLAVLSGFVLGSCLECWVFGLGVASVGVVELYALLGLFVKQVLLGMVGFEILPVDYFCFRFLLVWSSYFVKDGVHWILSWVYCFIFDSDFLVIWIDFCLFFRMVIEEFLSYILILCVIEPFSS